LASRAAELFERSKIGQKRELIAFVFSNLRLNGKKLDYSLRSPFDLMVNRRELFEPSVLTKSSR
jgi:site-specific DNA recombinase